MPLRHIMPRRDERSRAARRAASRRAQPERRNRLWLESLECRRLLAADDPTAVDPPPVDPAPGVVHGRKWEDLNGDGRRDDREPGLPGVTIYADLNWNGRLDADEPSTVTMRDIPETDFDEAGLYALEKVPPGRQLIREVVPRGYVQTYPDTLILPDDPNDPDAAEGDEAFSRVEPAVLELPLRPGERVVQRVSITINPICFRAFDIDVVSSDPSVKLENLSGVQINGCGGDTSRFEVAITAERPPLRFEIQFIDTLGGGVLDTIPVFTVPLPHAGGGHVVHIEPGGGVDGVHFGNTRRPSGAIEGRKWLDRDGNGQWDRGEPGLGGVIIYADLNHNGQFDRGEPRTVTEYENPDTDFDEAGFYQLSDLPPGEYLVREVLPRDQVQTFPGLNGSVFDSQTGRLNDGVAIDLDVIDVAAARGDGEAGIRADVQLTVVWPDSCGTLIDGDTVSVVVGNHILIELAGHQVGDACAEVISPQELVVPVSGLRPEQYTVVVVLHESIPGGDADLPTLTAVAQILIGGPGGHRVTLGPNELVSGINFGNRSTVLPGAVEGIKWRDDNGNGVRDEGEPGLPGVVIYADLNGNHQLDRGEPAARSQPDNPNTPQDESGKYELVGLRPGVYSIREVAQPGWVQTFPASGSRIEGVESENLPPGRALSLDLIGLQHTPSADGVLGAELTFQVVWPDGCGQLVDEATRFEFDGSVIYVRLLGTHNPDAACTLALVEETVTIHVPNVPPGSYEVDTLLRESERPDGRAEESFRLRAKLSLGGPGEHRVEVPREGRVSDVDFGNRRSDILPPEMEMADLDHDGHLDAQDIDLLAAAIRDHDPANVPHDLSGDGQLNQDDLMYLVENLMQKRAGDANLDGVFNSADLLKVFEAGEYEDAMEGNSGWETGDWNGDGEFNSSDLVFALQHGDYEA